MRRLCALLAIFPLAATAGERVFQGAIVTFPTEVVNPLERLGISDFITDEQLRLLFDRFFPTDEWHSQLLVFGQCFGGNQRGSWQDRPKTSVLYASGEGEAAYNGHYSAEVARRLLPGPGRNSATVHGGGVAYRHPNENPFTTGPIVSLEPLGGPIQSRHYLFFAGRPQSQRAEPGHTSDYYTLNLLRTHDLDLDGDQITVTAAGGSAGLGEFDYPGTLQGLIDAMEEVAQHQGPDEQLIFFVGDHGAQLDRDGDPVRAGKTAAGQMGFGPDGGCDLLSMSPTNNLVFQGLSAGGDAPIGPVEVRTGSGDIICPDAPFRLLDLDGNGSPDGTHEGWTISCPVPPALLTDGTVDCEQQQVIFEVADGAPPAALQAVLDIAPLASNSAPALVETTILPDFAPLRDQAVPPYAHRDGPTPALLLTGDDTGNELFSAQIDPKNPANSALWEAVDFGGLRGVFALGGMTYCDGKLFATAAVGSAVTNDHFALNLLQSQDDGHTWGVVNSFGDLVTNTRVKCYTDPVTRQATLTTLHVEAGGEQPNRVVVNQLDPTTPSVVNNLFDLGEGFAIDRPNGGIRADISVNPRNGDVTAWWSRVSAPGIFSLQCTTTEGTEDIADYPLSSALLNSSATSTGDFDFFVANNGTTINGYARRTSPNGMMRKMMIPLGATLASTDPTYPYAVGVNAFSVDVLSSLGYQRVDLNTGDVTRAAGLPSPSLGPSAFAPGKPSSTLGAADYSFGLQKGNSLRLYRPDTDGDGLADANDPCTFFFNLALDADGNGDGVPDECQCGDPNFTGQYESADLLVIFQCLNQDPQGLREPCTSIIQKGDTNFSGGNAQFESADLLNVFTALNGSVPGWTLRCPLRPDGGEPPARK